MQLRPRLDALRNRLLLMLLVPMGAIAAILAVGGAVLIHTFVQAAADRVLAGSVLAIAEQLTVEDGGVTVDLPTSALAMLGSQNRDSIYYSVSVGGRLITGYGDLPVDGAPVSETGTTSFRNDVYRQQEVRVAAQAREILGIAAPVLVQVAETTDGRTFLEREMLTDLALLELALVAVGATLAWATVGFSFRPLARLQREVDALAVDGTAGMAPLTPAGVPAEVMPLVRAVNDLLARLDQSIGILRRFTADASHQLRAPLAVLKTHVGLIRRLGTASPEGRAALDDVEGAVDRLAHLVGQLLALARADESGQQMPPLADTSVPDLVAAVRAVAADHVPGARRAGINIRFEGPGEGPEASMPVRVNALLLAEMAGNLIDNAVRYNCRGGSVVVRVRAEGDAVAVEIDDDGPGIAAQDRARVFERFFRAGPSDGPSGSGLGLPIVATLAVAMGARVTLETGRRGRGLCAVLHFKRLAARTPEPRRQPARASS